MKGSSILAVGGLIAAAVGSVGYVVEANRIMLAANIVCLLCNVPWLKVMASVDYHLFGCGYHWDSFDD